MALLSGPTDSGLRREDPLYLGTVTLEGQDEPVRVTRYQRDGSAVMVCQVEPSDVDAGMVPIQDGEPIKVMQAISHIGLQTNAVPGSVDGFMFGLRVDVPQVNTRACPLTVTAD